MWASVSHLELFFTMQCQQQYSLIDSWFCGTICIPQSQDLCIWTKSWDLNKLFKRPQEISFLLRRALIPEAKKNRHSQKLLHTHQYILYTYAHTTHNEINTHLQRHICTHHAYTTHKRIYHIHKLTTHTSINTYIHKHTDRVERIGPGAETRVVRTSLNTQIHLLLN